MTLRLRSSCIRKGQASLAGRGEVSLRDEHGVGWGGGVDPVDSQLQGSRLRSRARLAGE